MKRIISIVLFFITSAVLATHAGTISGTVRGQGKAEAEDSSGGDGKYASRKYKFAERVNYAELRDFVVSIEGPVGTNAIVAPTNPVVVSTTRIKQEGALFTPHVLPIMVGTTVQWPNNDEIFHNVFSVSDTTNFDLGLYKGNPQEKKITFN